MTNEDKSLVRPLQVTSNIPPDAREVLDEVEPRNVEQKRYIELLSRIVDGDMKNLTVCGTEGNGKTYLACCALTKYLLIHVQSPRTPFYVTQSEMNMMFRSAMHGDGTEYGLFQRFVDYSVLVIDEVGRSKNSDYQMETIEAIISKRYAWKRPTVIISNDSAEELRNLVDRHILDRLATGGTIEMIGKSQRRGK